MNMDTLIRQKLEAELSPDSLEVNNQSHLHEGHAGSPNSGQSHFKVKITSKAFEGLSRVAQHQLVYKILADEMKTHIHALALDTNIPQ